MSRLSFNVEINKNIRFSGKDSVIFADCPFLKDIDCRNSKLPPGVELLAHSREYQQEFSIKGHPKKEITWRYLIYSNTFTHTAVMK